ncbi:MAG TPA: MFS transporter [Deltaproteobacteria bacterium]|nr:MFS transporter [Deltaproteobacteria bacterium]
MPVSKAINSKSSVSQNKFHGWLSLAGVMLAYGGICGTMTYAYGVFLPAMSETFHWSRSSLSGPYTLYMVIGGMLGPLAGFTIARFGARKNIIFCNVFAALGLVGMSQVSELWHVYLFFGFMGGIAIAFAEYLPVTTIINNWFVRRRSLAMGLLFTSGGAAGFLFPPLISWFISGAGWRLSWLFLAGIHLLLTVILAGALIRSTPEELGQLPDGSSQNSWIDKLTFLSSKPVYSTPVDWTLGEALRSPALWMLIALFSVILFVLTLLTTHQVAYLQDLNFSPMTAAYALGLMLGTSIIGRNVCGVLGMRFEGRYLAAVFLTLMLLGILSLMHAKGITFVYLYSVFMGIGFGGMIVLLPNMIGAYFGRANYPYISGWTMPVVTLAFAGSPVLAGFFYDTTGTYTIPFGIAAVLLFACVILALFTRPPVKTAE